MELTEFADIIDKMIIEHDYPGFEARALKLGLPTAAKNSSQKMFASALGHENIFVKLAALRWFQERAGMAKTYTNAIAGLLDHSDAWVRLEAIQTLSKISSLPKEITLRIAALLKDQDIEVKKAAAKVTGKLVSKSAKKDEEIVASLQEAARDEDAGVRWKALKALRQIGAFEA